MFRKYKKIKKINNSKFGYDEKYIVDEDGRGLINVGAENYDDLYSYYDLDEKAVMDKEFQEYLEVKADSIPLNKELTIVFHVIDANEDKRQEIEKTLKDNYSKEVFALTREIRRNGHYNYLMLFLAFIMLSLYITIISLKLSEIIIILPEIGAWIFLWDAFENYFFKRTELKEKLLYKYRFVEANIKILEYTSLKNKTPISNNAKKLTNYINSTNQTNPTLSAIKDEEKTNDN